MKLFKSLLSRAIAAKTWEEVDALYRIIDRQFQSEAIDWEMYQILTRLLARIEHGPLVKAPES